MKKDIASNPLIAAETAKIHPSGTRNALSVSRQLINSKQYHDKFLKLPFPKAVQESLYQSAMKILI
ncbi:hypothetical protein [Levilactobacillus koreensis]|uniref:Uncharacterized protein n=1 Tax=Levilactobacillus koreensis TaxID=637971 RepID=A0AAC8UX39_9LACO|nr:hypothetical protein [Levilactobacillus koreensis]AKP65272.1 hypothetical protein ABN16_09845 [Levilactobacillus koreensis]